MQIFPELLYSYVYSTALYCVSDYRVVHVYVYCFMFSYHMTEQVNYVYTYTYVYICT